MTKRELRRSAHLLKTWATAIAKGIGTPKDDADKVALSETAEMLELSKKLYAMARFPR